MRRPAFGPLAALERGDVLSAEALDRAPELKLGPAANSMERRAQAAALREGRDYVPVTERGAVVHAARQARLAFAELRERLARIVGRGEPAETARDAVSAPGHGRERLREAMDRERGADESGEADDDEKRSIRERLDDVLNRPRERLEVEDEPEREEEKDVEIRRGRNRGPTHGL